MAVLDATRSAHVSQGGTSLFVSAFASIAKWNDARQTRKALSALTDRELEDIGLCRGDIDVVAVQNFRR